MTKTTHTNRGTCQVCGRLQAIDNATGIVAKHGYKVAGYHFFMGVCPGARYLPAEKDLTVTHRIMEQLTEQALQDDADAAALRAFEIQTNANDVDFIDWQVGAKRLTHYDVWDYDLPVTKVGRYGVHYASKGGYVTHEITNDTKAYVIEREQNKAALIEETNARHARTHVKMMNEHIVPRFGQPLAPTTAEAVIERKVAKAKAVEGVRFPTKQSRKDALDKLNREYDKAHHMLQDMYLALPHDKRTEAKTEVYYGPMQLNHWRPKHAVAALREFPEAASIVTTINNLVTMRDAIKATV
jgi:hypothetical protein